MNMLKLKCASFSIKMTPLDLLCVAVGTILSLSLASIHMISSCSFSFSIRFVSQMMNFDVLKLNRRFLLHATNG